MSRDTTTPVKGLYAFWRYDQYPYVTGGTIVDINENGYVECKEYGRGYRFKPLLILPVKQGKELRHQLELLEQSYRKAKAQLRDEWEKKAIALSPITDRKAQR